jgi:hypothetical protein
MMHRKQAMWKGWFAVLLFQLGCAAQVDDDLPEEAPPVVDQAQVVISESGARRLGLWCEAPRNNACPDGYYGRICHVAKQQWCEVWSCGSDGCVWMRRD